MNEHEDNTAPHVGAMPFSRRAALKLGAVLALTAHTPVGMADDAAFDTRKEFVLVRGYRREGRA